MDEVGGVECFSCLQCGLGDCYPSMAHEVLVASRGALVCSYNDGQGKWKCSDRLGGTLPFGGIGGSRGRDATSAGGCPSTTAKTLLVQGQEDVQCFVSVENCPSVVSAVLGVATQPRQWDAFRRHLRLLVLHGVEHSLGKRVSFLCVASTTRSFRLIYLCTGCFFLLFIFSCIPS